MFENFNSIVPLLQGIDKFDLKIFRNFYKFEWFFQIIFCVKTFPILLVFHGKEIHMLTAHVSDEG